jgi:hypothetical protein
MLLVFFRAMVKEGAVKSAAFSHVTEDKGLTFFLAAWVGCFYAGVLLLAVAFLVARSVPRWVPALLVGFVVMQPIAPHLGRVGMAVQILALAVAFTGIAMAAVTGDSARGLSGQPAF